MEYTREVVMEYFALLKKQGKPEVVWIYTTAIKVVMEENQSESFNLLVILLQEYLSVLQQQGEDAKWNEIMARFEYLANEIKKEQ